MIKQALEYINGLSKANLFEIHDMTFSDKSLCKVEVPKIKGFETSTLSSIVDYIVKDPDQLGDIELIINIESPTKVVLKTRNHKPYLYRDTLIETQAYLPNLHYSRYLDVENFIIELQSKYVPNDFIPMLIGLVSSIEEQQIQKTTDDGISQVVTAKTGIARVGEVIVPNPVALKPFRTFVEVDQPESLFVFRMQSGPSMALYEADGGAWRNEAISNIKTYFESNELLKERIEANKLIVMA